MKKAVYSKIFSEKLRGFVPARQADIRKAIDRVLVDPLNNNYHRPYLKPYRQEHASEKIMTIFFVVEPKLPDIVFFAWVNDDQFPHDTHKNHGPDPCIDEFVRLQRGQHLEQYSKDFHEGKFTFVPRATAPNFMKFEKYGASVYSNISYDTVTHFTMAITSMNQPNQLFDHYKLFIHEIREHFHSQGQPFEFRVLPGDTAFQNILQSNANPAHWNQTTDGGMDIWSVR